MSLSDYAANKAAPREAELPRDWKLTTEFSGSTGTASVPRREPVEGSDREKERQLLTDAGYDPDRFMITGDVSVSKWQQREDGPFLYCYKFRIAAMSAVAAETRDMDVAELMSVIRKPKKQQAVSGRGCFTVSASDWQIGKGEGDGTAGTVDRVADGIDQAVARVKELRRIGRTMPQGAFVGTGDLVEGTCGFYSNQPYLIDMNDREQTRTVMALLTYGIEELSPLFEDFVIATSLDNHGQKRSSDGKLTTDLSDNKTAECYDNVFNAFSRDARYGNLRWVIPNDEPSVLVELGGVPVGLSHGDLFSGGGKLPQMKALEWWRGQDFGMQPLRGARVLMSGHFHHYSAIMHGGRTHFQMPANDSGSKWFTDGSGYDSPPGTFTVVFDDGELYGWTDQALLT